MQHNKPDVKEIDPQHDSGLSKLPPSLLRYITHHWLDKRSVDHYSQTCKLFHQRANKVFFEKGKEKKLRDLATYQWPLNYNKITFNTAIPLFGNKHVDKIVHIGNHSIASICNPALFDAFYGQCHNDIYIINYVTGELSFTIEKAHLTSINSIVYLGNGILISNTAQEIKIWNLQANYQCVRTIERKDKHIISLKRINKQSFIFSEYYEKFEDDDTYIVTFDSTNDDLTISKPLSLGYFKVSSEEWIATVSAVNLIKLYNIKTHEFKELGDMPGICMKITRIHENRIAAYNLFCSEIKIWNLDGQLEKKLPITSASKCGINLVISLTNDLIAVAPRSPTLNIEIWDLKKNTLVNIIDMKAINPYYYKIRKILLLKNHKLAIYCDTPHIEPKSEIIIFNYLSRRQQPFSKLIVKCSQISNMMVLPDGNLSIGDTNGQLHLFKFARKTTFMDQHKPHDKNLKVDYNLNCSLM